MLHTERRTFYRWIGGDTEPPGIVGLMLDLLKENPQIEAVLVEKAALTPR